MKQIEQPDWADLFAATRVAALHLEMRDVCAIEDEADDVAEFLATGRVDADPDSEWWLPWTSLVRDAVARGVVVRRARIVSEPVTDYVRYLHAITPANLSAGESVRWLPRRHASDLALPGNDFWLFDDTVLFNLFTGDGDIAGYQTTDDPAVVTLCRDAFEAVWDRSVPHEDYSV